MDRHFQMFTDIWRFFKKYAYVYDRKNKNYWLELIRETDELSAKYNSKLMDQLILVCVDDIDRRYMASINKPWKSDPLEQVYERLKRNRGKKT